MRRLLLVMFSAFALTFGAPSSALAQDGPTTTAAELPPADIIPRPDSGTAPSEAGDRGGALQLGLLALVVVVISGAVANLVRQSRRARESGS